MNGTCLRCEAETHYSFYEDLLSLRMLNDLVYSIEESARKVCMDCSKYIVRWKRRSSVWSFEKRLVCERFAAKKPTLLQYDEKLSYYTLMLEELQDMAVYYDLGSIRINLKPLLNGIAKHANQWKQTYADCLLNDVLVEMREFRSKIEQLRNEIELVVTGLERFTLIMQAISDIRRMAVQAEVQYASYREMFLLLRAHNVDFEEIDEKIALQLQSDWESLYLGAMYRMTTLETTSDRFAELTEQAISNFLEEMTSFTEDFEKNGPASVGDDLELALTIMDSYGKRIDQLDERKSSLVRSELLFDLTPADYSSLTKMKKEMEGMQRLLDLYKRQKNARSDWARTLWADLNPQQLLDGMDAFIKELRSFPRAVRKLEMGQSLDAIMKNFKNSVPLFVELKNEAMRERHWMELMKQTGRFFDMTPDRFTLENMFAMELGKYEEIAQTIVRNATRELAIERGLKELSDTWKAMELILVKHWKGAEDRGSILGPINDLIQALDDDMLNVHSMAASRYIGPFAETVKQWETTMHITSEVLELWTEFQRKWLYLEGIFVGGDIRLQLPEEAKKFDDIDKMYRKIMLDASKRLNVIECCGIPARGDEFKAMIANLERCQKNLADYLRSKRNLFPRFIFLSDDELLGILSKSEPTVIQEHIGKIFDNLAKIEITQDQSNRSVATALISNEAEFMSYRNPVLLAGKIENWMSNVLAEMKSSNRYWTKKAIYDFAKIDKASRIRWILQYEGMMILAADQVWWTAEVEETFRRISIGKSQAMKEYLQELNDRLENVVSLMGKDNLRANDRKKFDTLLTIDVHLRDIIENFVRDNITNGTLFEWESQLKFYWVHDLDNIWVHQCTGSFEYGYEYMGLNGRLVITPLTDRIYLTFTQALSMHLGGAPAGPAGTGKTETTKDLAKALGLLCLVTNCGESMDYLAIGRILSGLAQCGAWGCFDEFNRIDVSVLSVISTQLHAIRTALLSKAKRFMLEGADAGEDDLVLDRKVGVFITMNPGYAGRSELPESVKSLFRPVTCVVPDKEIICQIRLFSSGYLSAKILAKKIIVLYKLAEDQLSKQVHYDFGLRSLKSVLSMADNLMRSGGTEDGSGGQQSHENVLLTRALRDINLPKLITDDVSLFNGLMTDLFPDLKSTFSKNPYPELMKAVKRVLKTRRYIQIQEQIDKIIQLFQAMITRHSCMVVGPTTSGKTIIIETLCEAQTQLTQPTEIFVLNPKACTVNELYGTLDPISRDWNDGIFSKIFRTVNRPRGADEKSSYIVFDGDVDALWIENMNSLMDDNKLLTLANQERIKLRDNCKLLFEVGDLRYASPATVSRAGMVYVDLSTLGYQAYMDRWIESREHKNDESLLNDLCTKYVHGAIQLIQEGIFGSRYTSPLKTVVPQTALNMVSQLCFTMDGLCVLVEVQLNKEREAEKEKEKEKEKEEKDKPVEAEIDPSNVLIDKMSREEIFEAIYILSCYFSFGAALTTPSSKRTFDEYMKTTSGFMLVEETVDNPASIRCLPTKGKTLFEYTLDLETKIWIHWRKLLPAYVHDKELARRGKTFVPTPDTIRTLWFLDLMQKRNRPILLIGERATAKSAIAQQFLNHLSSTESNHIRLSLSFSPRTTSMDVQANLESNLEKRTRDVYGPPAGKSLIFFIDDVNMPTIDTYGTQQPIAFLKFLMERSAFYDRSKDLNLKNVKDIYYIAAMGEPGTGRNEVDPRFVSLFSVYNVSTLSIPSLQTIYASILRGHLSTSSFPTQVQDIASKIISLTLKLYQFISSKFLPTPSKFHYAFDTRDLSRIVAGMLQSEPEDFSTAKQFLRLWRNEFTRVICDRLINEEDSTLLREEVEKAISAVTWPGQSETVAYALRDPLLFGDLKNASPDSDIPPEQESRSYTDLLDYEAVYNLFMEILEDYNENNTNKIRMVLFNDALEHLVRVHRVIRMERGHTLLVGMAGSGKRSIVKLAAYAAKCGVFEISLRLKYNEQSFREDMKKLFWLVGVDKKKTLFFFSESHIVDETFLEMVNNILTSGLIPGLFSDEEKDAIVASWRESSREASSREAAWSCFERSCTDNLRVALSMSPSGDKLRNRCRDYPGLLNCTTIDWMFSWPEQALLAVGSVRLREVLPEEMRDLIVKHAVHVHLSVGEYSKEYMRKLRRFNYATPKHYLDFVNTYMDLLTVGRDYAKFRCDRLSGGLERIAEASVTLNELNAALAVQRLKVAEQTRNCEELMRGIEEGTEVALGKREASMEKRREIEEQKKIIGREEREAKGVLAEAEPILDAARMALSELEKSDITEIRSFATPPDAVRIVTECVAILCNVKDVSWKGAKGMMADPSFLRILQEMKVEKITLKQQQAVKAHLKKSDKLDQMANISKAGYGLYKFVLAVLGYCTVYREVKPKMERVEQLAYESARAQKLLEKEESELRRVETEIGSLSEKYEAALTERQALQEETDVLQRRLIAADKLIGGLASENDRWRVDLASLRQGVDKIIGDSLLSASFLTYAGPFTASFRNIMIYHDWKKSIADNGIPYSHNYRIEGQLSNDVEASAWNSEGLPPDDLSIQNAILTLKSSRSPVCIDPQQQAVNWIRRRERSSNLKILSFSDSDFLKQVELAIRYGTPVLFQDIEEIDPILENVLAKNIQTPGGRQFVMLGEKEIDYDPKFRIYLTTKIANPSFDPTFYAKAQIINYTVTDLGLEDQLLSVLVRTERPDIEEQRESLIAETSEHKKLLEDLEDSLLREISSNVGNMLDNFELIATLERTKASASQVTTKLFLAQVTAKDLNKLRDNYRLVARRAAALFFVLADMAILGSMYQFSLESYLQVFVRSLRKALPDPTLAKRLANILPVMTSNVYDYGCLAIFQRHKLLYSFQICRRLELQMQQQKQGEKEDTLLVELHRRQLHFFAKGDVSQVENVESLNSANPTTWVSSTSWADLVKLSNDFPNKFSELPNQLKDSNDQWKAWYESDSPEEIDYPCGYSQTLNAFEKLMLIRCFRVDRVCCAVMRYIDEKMGERYVLPAQISFDTIYEQSSAVMPVIFILSPGADPSAELVKLADKYDCGGGKFRYLSLGQGQEKLALELLETALARGQWLLLQNCHLLLPFTRLLDKYLENIQNPHPDFRLWLTTDPIDNFPIGILQRSLKIVTEPPSGLKLNLRNTYFRMSSDLLEQCEHPAYKDLIYTLAFYHAVLQERKKYGKVGWNVSYDFNESDFSVCSNILETYLKKALQQQQQESAWIIPWKSIKYLIGEVMYGGRVVDFYDRRVSRIYMDEYFGDFAFDTLRTFHFFQDPDIDYVIPPQGNRDDYIKYIDDLPLIDRPEVFGLHSNAEIAYFTRSARNMWTDLLQLQPQTGEEGSRDNKDKFIENMAKDLLDKLPRKYNIKRLRKNFAPSIPPTTVVLIQELGRVNQLSSVMRRTLMQLRKAIAGEIGMDAELEEISISLFNGSLPKVWAKYAPANKKNLAGWAVHFQKRVAQYSNWSSSGEPAVIWLSGLHIPETYLAALVQVACRKNDWPLDRSVISTTVTHFTNVDEIEEKPQQGCYVHGLYLEGARWDMEKHCLERSHPKILIEQLPILKVTPIESHRLRLQNTIKTPVYTTLDRNNAMGVGIVFEADLAATGHVSHWILQGVCLILNTD
ncbi:dynein axonemal heavy chain 10 [Prorops nasuta]|uniref:dynein axonemal heavy chain 10 n=1 Tax=Prorops nasuta TaxID=863751 RepID=UPI0034CDA551